MTLITRDNKKVTVEALEVCSEKIVIWARDMHHKLEYLELRLRYITDKQRTNFAARAMSEGIDVLLD